MSHADGDEKKIGKLTHIVVQNWSFTGLSKSALFFLGVHRALIGRNVLTGVWTVS